MRNKQNSYDRTGSSSDFSNNEGYQNYQDRTDHNFSNRPSTTSDASMYGSDNQRQGRQYETGYGQGSSQSERFDARNNGNYGFGSYSSARGGYESSQPSNSSGNFSWPTSDRKSGLHAGKGPKGYRRSDESIREEVSEFLSAHSEIDASEIEIEVKEGMVILSGTVESRQIKRLVEDTIEAVSGVQDIKNDLRVMAKTESSPRPFTQDTDSTSSRSIPGKTNLAGRQSASMPSTSNKSVQ